MTSARSPLRSASWAVALAITLFLPACGSHGGTSTGTSAGAISARLTIYRVQAAVRKAGQSPFAPGVNREALALNDTVRTDDAGFAEVDYPDGSLTRLDVDTTFTVTQLVDTPGKRVAAAHLGIGRAWNRVAKVTGSGSFSISTPNAVASAHGTVFVVSCDATPVCRFIDIEGSIEVRTNSGADVVLQPGQELDVGPTGTATGPIPFSGTDAWLDANRSLDAGTPFPPSPTPTSTSAPTPPGPPLFVRVKVLGVNTSPATCTATETLRWTPHPDDPRFQGEAVIQYGPHDDPRAKTKRVPWTDGHVDVKLSAKAEAGGFWTLDAALVSVGGTPVDPTGATSIGAGQFGLFSGC